jgi:hypothetical protein
VSDKAVVLNPVLFLLEEVTPSDEALGNRLGCLMAFRQGLFAQVHRDEILATDVTDDRIFAQSLRTEGTPLHSAFLR